MKKLVFATVLLFLLACAEELPPSPPLPGGEVVGRALAGIAIPVTRLPLWAASMVYTDISPTSVSAGDTVVVTITGPGGSTYYAYSIIYVLNKFGAWEKVYADKSLSGKITKDWAKGKAV